MDRFFLLIFKQGKLFNSFQFNGKHLTAKLQLENILWKNLLNYLKGPNINFKCENEFILKNNAIIIIKTLFKKVFAQ